MEYQYWFRNRREKQRGSHRELAKKSRIRGGDSGDYDYNYDDYYDIKHTGRLKQYPTNPGHSQTDITFYSPVRARISDRIRVPWFCAGTVLAVVSSATGPTECLKY